MVREAARETAAATRSSKICSLAERQAKGALARAEGDDWDAEQRRAMALLATAFRRPPAEVEVSEQTDRSVERPALAPVPLSGAQLPEPEGRWRATPPLQQRGLNCCRATYLE